MDHANALVHSVEELLAVCSRSIVAPNMIILEANRIMTILNDQNVEQKFIVEGCEKLSLLAAGFIRSGFESFTADYARKSGIDHMASGFANRNELVKYCEYCVEHGDESLHRIRYSLMSQLELENGMTEDEIRSLNVKKSGSDLNTVQDQMTDYIKLSLLVNSLKEFFKQYYKGLH
ncbi:MAG TPA: hypothetical protein VN381_15565 [Anaerovoracaceae bacterium]|nr:hypothetical protein [Anaerovoracaceae bacterium]